MLAQKLQQGHAADFLDNQARNYKIGVAVLPLGRRIKIKRLARPLVENLLRCDGLEHEWRNVVLRPVVLVARSVRKQLTNRNLAAAGQVGYESRHGIVERKLALFRQQQHCGCRKLLADGANAVAHRGQRGCVRVDAAVAIGLEVSDRSALHNSDRGARNAGAGQRLAGDGVDFVAQGGGKWHWALRFEKRNGEQNENENGAQISRYW